MGQTFLILAFAQFGLCCFMAGVILVIQLVHYPTLGRVASERFLETHLLHTTGMGWVAAPAMIAELLTAAWLAVLGGGGWWVNFAGVVALWACTFFLSVPLHNRLARERSDEALARLVRTNWPRTVLWMGRAVVLGAWWWGRVA